MIKLTDIVVGETYLALRHIAAVNADAASGNTIVTLIGGALYIVEEPIDRVIHLIYLEKHKDDVVMKVGQ